MLSADGPKIYTSLKHFSIQDCECSLQSDVGAESRKTTCACKRFITQILALFRQGFD